MDAERYCEQHDDQSVYIHRVKEVVTYSKVSFPVREGKLIALSADRDEAKQPVGDVAPDDPLEPTI